MDAELILRPLGKHSPASAELRDHYVVLVQGEWVGSIELKTRANGQESIWLWSISCELQGDRQDQVPRRPGGMTDSRDEAMREFRAA